MTKMPIFNLFATTPKGLELLLVDELRALGAADAAEKLAGVTFTGNLELAYQACLWSRLANRILLRLAQVPAATPEELYAGVQTIAWDQHMNPTSTLNVNFTTAHSNITHTLFGAQKVKDAIVDQFRDKYHERPNVARENADININVYLHRNIATISLDLSGESLHKRGYRLEQGAAPLKENLAAAILIRAGWKKIAEQKSMLLDPMCGSGTFLIEAALMAGDIAPGLLRNYFGFLGWKQHDAELWNRLLTAAQQRREQGMALIPTIIGHDADSHAIKIAFANIERAGMHGKIHVEKQDVSLCVPKEPNGLLVVNPPYGERLGEMPELPKLYVTLGERLKKEFAGWQAAVFTGNPDLAKAMGIRARKYYALFNGAIPCQLLLFDVKPEYFIDRSPEGQNERRIFRAKKLMTEADQAHAQMFANRVLKNRKNLQRWLEKENISSYRLYDADLPEYAVAIDIYNDYVCVQEYPAPKSIDKSKAEQRLLQVLAMLPEALDKPSAKIFLRERGIQIDVKEDLYKITENANQFLVNLRDADLDSGLPLEQRGLRAHIQNNSAGKSFLNLFSRSGSMAVCAAKGGALSTKSVIENEFNYAWTKRNMELNGLTGLFVPADVSTWILREKTRYNLIFAELPESHFRDRFDYADLIPQICQLLTPEGELYLVAHDARFKLDPEFGKAFDINAMSAPFDFSRHPKMLQCWHLKAK
ncbi:MAG: bifunctional 23S rRNA (guanine(2069)-N(7))-methyltransferase RlmK/23S rRNA (guanine(2445)-N(2))-methyltransferase RlmL [Gammaproteobacteria bacterium]